MRWSFVAEVLPSRSRMSRATFVPRTAEELRGQRQRGQHHEREGGRRPHCQLFSSRLSSFRKRQSAASAMILFGVDLIMPASRNRNE